MNKRQKKFLEVENCYYSRESIANQVNGLIETRIKNVFQVLS